MFGWGKKKEEVEELPLTKANYEMTMFGEDADDEEEDEEEMDNLRTYTMEDGQVAHLNQTVHLTTIHEDGKQTFSVGYITRIFDQGFYSDLQGLGTIATGFPIKNEDGTVNKNNNNLHLQLITIDGKPAYWGE
jgi:hypothetical protein